jgi:hypothetical protein
MERKLSPMKNLFEPAAKDEIKMRIDSLTPRSEHLWGTMNAAQALAHCAIGLEIATGDKRPPRALIGYILGPIFKPLVLKNDDPMRRNSPTVKGMVVADERILEREQKHLCGLIDRFVAAGPAGCATHPHSFLGRLTPEEWAILAYKHLDHHLRQFGA